jgi:hypothetical protein
MSPSEIGVMTGLAVVWMDARVEPAHDGRGGRQPMRNHYLDEIV